MLHQKHEKNSLKLNVVPPVGRITDIIITKYESHSYFYR